MRNDILKSFEKAMGGVKLIEKKSSQKLMDFMGLKETLHRLAKANEM